MSKSALNEIATKIVTTDFVKLDSPVKDIFDAILARTSEYTKAEPEVLITNANKLFDYLNQGKLITDTKTAGIKKLFEQYINAKNYKQPNNWLEFLAQAKAGLTPEEEMFS
jgi:hypothetical protein